MTIDDQTPKQGGADDKLITAPITDDIGFLLAKLHTTGSILNNKALAGFALKERSYSVLILADSGLEPTQRELADFLSLDPSQIVALVDALEERGLVARAPGKQDRRARTITATADGSQLLAEARQAGAIAEAHALQRLTAPEITTLKALLRKALWG
jgi:DNA-binding MarR family transcriptional regulator